MLELRDYPLILRTDRCLSPELLVTEGADHTERSVVLRVRSLGTPRCSNLVGTSSLLSQHLSSPFAGASLAGTARPDAVEDSPLSLPQSVLPTQDICGTSARRRRPAGTRNKSTRTYASAGRLSSGRIAGVGLLGHLANGRQPRYGLTKGEGDGKTSKGAKGARPRRRRLVQGKQQRYGTMLMDLERSDG